ncbi:MAG: DHH family phosphoesterase [Candidatus Helarchaeota archaeon]
MAKSKLDYSHTGRNLLFDMKLNKQLTVLLQYTYLYSIVRFRMGYRQISIITHRDFDGVISAAFLLSKYPYARLFFSANSTLYKTLHVIRQKSARTCPHTLFILDFNIDSFYLNRVIKALTKFRKVQSIDIYWFDHHPSPVLETITSYVELIHDVRSTTTADLVYRHINPPQFTQMFFDILYNAQTPFARYWRAVLQTALRLKGRYRLLPHLVKQLSSFHRDEVTQNLFLKYQQRTEEMRCSLQEIYTTHGGYQFGLLKVRDNEEIYVKVRQILQHERLDFLLVEFGDGSFSAYKSKTSRIDLTPLYELVGGKGHNYAFHFLPQIRVNAEFFRPLGLADLVMTVKEVL